MGDTLKNIVDLGAMSPDAVQITGENNEIIADCMVGSRNLRVKINGHNNRVHFGKCVLKDLTITIGSYLPVSGVELVVGKHFSIEPGGRFEILTDFARIHIGESCLFSRNITLHYGDSPHLIFDRATGAYRDGGGGVSIGQHVWVGENVYMTKNAGVAADCIVAACCVLTKTFDEPNCAYGGNPARKIASDITWFRNRPLVPSGTPYADSIRKHDEDVVRRLDGLRKTDT